MKVWGGAMVGLVAGFFVGYVISQEFVVSEGGRATSATVLSLLAVVMVPVILCTFLGARLAGQLRIVRPARSLGSVGRQRLADGKLA